MLRKILDKVLIANEVIEDYKERKQMGAVFNIDFEKAYKHVHLKFLDKVLEKKGFGSNGKLGCGAVLDLLTFPFM